MSPSAPYNPIPMAVTRKFPTHRDKPGISRDDWLSGREADEGAEGLWRIHDGLYDLTTFITRHPGGRDWIELTRGIDITEAFEIHHLQDEAKQLLPKFYVRAASNPRNSLLTFKEDGFYKTLKRNLEKHIKDYSGPSIQSQVLADFLVAATFSFAALGVCWSPYFCIVSGFFLYCLTITAHNFLHMKDSWRMYYFNFSLMSYREWRISHVLSHHLFPNTIMDLEIATLEPFFQYLPSSKKSFAIRYLSWMWSPLVFLGLFHFEGLRRWLDVVLSRKLRFHPDELACLMIPLAMLLSGLAASSVELWTVFLRWNLTIVSGSFFFSLVSLSAAHHHPDIFHDGDTYVENKDFGLLQLAAVKDRVEINENFFLVMISFGDHALHHLFPTIDHYRLPKLYPVFLKTCEEFGFEYKPYTTCDLFTGMYKQLAKNYSSGQLVVIKNKNS